MEEPQPQQSSPPSSPPPVVRETCLYGLLQRRSCWLPTGKLLAIGFLLALITLGAFLLGIHPFLASSDPLPDGALVVEGWGDDDMMLATIAMYRSGHYSAVYVTGSPITKGAPLASYGTQADLGAATINRLNHGEFTAIPVPCLTVNKDRTYTSAEALRDYLKKAGKLPVRFTLISANAHARRSRMLFQEAFGADATIGIVAIDPEGYDPKHWWSSSEGARTVISETIAYLYARFLFWKSLS